MEYIDTKEEKWLSATCLDKRIKTSFFGKDKYLITLSVDEAIGKRVFEYQVSMEDYYKVEINKPQKFVFCKISDNDMWYLKGSIISI